MLSRRPLCLIACLLAAPLAGLAACQVGEVTASGGSGDDDDDDSAPPSADGSPAATVDGGGSGGDQPDANTAKFSFFVTGIDHMLALAGSEDGFGGDLGGLAGADSICQQIAENVGFGHKTWRAFLSVTDGGDGNPVHAIDRIGDGPWYDRNERLIALDRTGLLNTRPDGDAATVSDLPDEYGQPLKQFGDNHDVLTGSNTQGQLDDSDPIATCNDWTSAVGPGSENRVRAGHAWPAGSGEHWITAHRLRGCSPGVNLEQDGAGSGDCVGCSGGYGAIYCFALTP